MNILQYIVSLLIGAVAFVGIVVITLQYPIVVTTFLVLFTILILCFKSCRAFSGKTLNLGNRFYSKTPAVASGFDLVPA